MSVTKLKFVNYATIALAPPPSLLVVFFIGPYENSDRPFKGTSRVQKQRKAKKQVSEAVFELFLVLILFTCNISLRIFAQEYRLLSISQF